MTLSAVRHLKSAPRFCNAVPAWLGCGGNWGPSVWGLGCLVTG
jgi:hypothetical protein